MNIKDAIRIIGDGGYVSCINGILRAILESGE